MGALTVEIPKALTDKLDRLSRKNDLPQKMLKSAMDVMEPELKRRMASHSRTGELINSVKRSDPAMNTKGEWKASIYFDGYDTSREATKSDPRGIPNDRKMMSLELGTSKQVATPIIRPTKEAKKSEAEAAMQATFDSEVQK